MFSHEVKLRVRYSETDRMGYAYYGNYAGYYEVARVEALRVLGINYKDLEDNGILLPVLEYSIKYLKPAFYDDELTIVVKIENPPTAKIRFLYETYNNRQVLLNTGETTLVFVNKNSGRPRPCPPEITYKLKEFGL